MTASSSRMYAFAPLTPELLLHVAEFLPPQDLCRFESTCKECQNLDMTAVWKLRCHQRWAAWPRYRLTPEREQDMLDTSSSAWKKRYFEVEREATRNELRDADLHNSRWFLSFVLSGIRGEGLSDHVEVRFLREPRRLIVPGYPPLPYQIVRDEPPPSSRVRQNLRGDHTFSKTHWLCISDFPAHFVARKTSDAEWLIVNENVMLVSSF